MPILTPVFHFSGQCEEAIESYKKAFGADLKFILRYSDADIRDFDVALTDDQKNMVYHSELMIGKQRIMMADEMDVEQVKSVSQFLTVTFDTPEEVKMAYEVLIEGGTIIYPLHSTTYSSCMASIVDKFGFRWGLMTER
jgi:PhnB protein